MTASPRAAAATDSSTGTIVRTADPRDLALIRRPDVQAVVCSQASRTSPSGEVAARVADGTFKFARVTLSRATRPDIERWLAAALPTHAVSGTALAALELDVLDLVSRCASLTDSSHFEFRALVGPPTTRCGYHVDTAPPGRTSISLLRVFCGPTTEYVEPTDVISIQEFYRYLARRERWTRELSTADSSGEEVASHRLAVQFATMDDAPSFLRPGAAVHVVPDDTVVAFKVLDVSRHWSRHPKAAAWIHRSPMAGAPRLLVTVSAR